MVSYGFWHAKSISGTILLIVGIFGSFRVKFKVETNLKGTGRSCSE